MDTPISCWSKRARECTVGLPDSPGVTAANTHDTLVAPFNDLAAVEKLVDEFASDLAAVIVEPIAGNMAWFHRWKGFGKD